MKKETTIETAFVEKEASAALENGYSKAEKLLNDEDKLERFLQKLERKLKVIPLVGDKLSEVPAMASLLKSYIQKEYTDIPVGTIIAVISALAYFISPVDIIPDTIPGVGHIDDAFVVGACLKLVEDDIQDYLEWRKQNHKELLQ